MTPAERWYRYERYPYLLARLLLYVGFAFALYTAFEAVSSVLVPVLLSLLIAYLLDPVVDWFEARGSTRTRAILGLLAGSGAAVFAFVVFLYPAIAHAIGKAVTGIPTLANNLETEVLPWLEANLGIETPASLAQILEEYGSLLQEQLPVILNRLATILRDVWSSSGNLASSLLNAVMIPVFTFYFLRDFDEMKGSAGQLLPIAGRAWWLERLRRMDEVVGAWFRGQVEVAVILAALYGAGLGMVFGFAGIGATAGLAIGVLAGLLNVIPYFGFLVGIGLALLMVILEGTGVTPVIGVLAVFGIVQGLEGYVITPRIVGDKVGLSAVAVIIALLLGGEVLGLLGILLALPIAGILRVLWPDLVAYYKATSLYRGEATTASEPFDEDNEFPTSTGEAAPEP